jgi:hypothetical protein
VRWTPPPVLPIELHDAPARLAVTAHLRDTGIQPDYRADGVPAFRAPSWNTVTPLCHTPGTPVALRMA